MHRNAATIKRLRMYRGGKPVRFENQRLAPFFECSSRARAIFRNKKGKIVKPAEYQGRLPSGTVSRIDPNRKWFGKVFSCFFGL